MAETAKVDGRIVIAQELSILEWVSLHNQILARRVEVEMPYCAHPGHVSTSSRGLQFFRHYANAECEYASGPESAEHVFAKLEMHAGAQEAGWTATIERSSETGVRARWRADVLAELGEKRVALEIQASRQPTRAYLRRHLRYRNDGVESLWFVSGDATGVERLDRLVPAVRVRIGFDHATVRRLDNGSSRDIPLREFVRRWLLGEIGPGKDAPRSTVSRPPRLHYPALRPVAAIERAPSHLPQRPCVDGCEPGMSFSNVMEVWVCMTCRRTIAVEAANPAV